MSCFRLRPAWRDREPNANGKYPITFSRKGSQLEPDLYIPCGKCPGCAANKAKEWSIRMIHEGRLYDRNSFLTLTYDPEKCPEKINKPDVQKFIKRLRKASDRPIRYFVTGEYGETTRRPHYHAIIFNEDFMGGARPHGRGMYVNQLLNDIWQQGFVVVAEFNPATANYVAGYTTKKIGDKDTFSMQSRNPPLGWEYAMKHQKDFRDTEKVVISGHEYPIPSAYLDWYDASKFRPGRVDLDGIKENRVNFAAPVTQAVMRNREINHNGKQKLKEHNL